MRYGFAKFNETLQFPGFFRGHYAFYQLHPHIRLDIMQLPYS